MSVRRYTFDTNLLFYALDSSSPEKHRIARQLVVPNGGRSVLLLQSLGELCNAIRKKRPAQTAMAYRWVERGLTLFEVFAAASTDLTDAIQAQEEHGLAFWDAMLWATARRTGCTLLLTEDFQNERVLGGVQIRNPFRMSERERDELLNTA